MKNHLNERCIYIHNLTRKDEVAFIGNVGYFGGNLIMMIPHKQIDLHAMVSYLNSSDFKERYTFSGRFKIGQSQILKAGFKINKRYINAY